MSIIPSLSTVRIAMGCSSNSQITSQRLHHTRQVLVASAKTIAVSTAGFFVGVAAGPIGLGFLYVSMTLIQAIAVALGRAPSPVSLTSKPVIEVLFNGQSWPIIWMKSGLPLGALLAVGLAAQQFGGVEKHLLGIYNPKQVARQEVRALFNRVGRVAVPALGLLLAMHITGSLRPTTKIEL